MKIYLSKYYKLSKNNIEEILLNFDEVGVTLFAEDKGRRNLIKVIEKDGNKYNIKFFKRPNFINRYVYVLFRKSKAERSFEFAERLIQNGIGTPIPIAFAEEAEKGALTKSYYISEHLDYDLTFRDLDLATPGHEDVLRAFAKFTYDLHEKRIEFLDHSAGNTLIKLTDGNYKFYLVDLNRMSFKSLNFNERMKNFERLTTDKAQVKIMAEEYAALLGISEDVVFEKMWFYTNTFFTKRKKNRRFKKKLKKVLSIK